MARSTTTEEQAAPQRTVVYLGNRKAIERIGEGDNVERRPLPGKRCTRVVLPAGITLMDAVRDITAPQGVWAAHSDAPAPAWVAADGPLAEAVTQILAAQYPGIEVRDPEPEPQEG
jgi:hypothetical protein